MAFSPRLPRNSESRALGVAMRILRKSYPQLEWVVSFADGTRCGDGTIYRASGFVLTGITKNDTIMETPDGERITNLSITANWDTPRIAALARKWFKDPALRYRPIKDWTAVGCRHVPGWQLRYLYFLNPAARARLTVPEIAFSEIERRGVGIYLGRGKQAMAGLPPGTAAG